jgi:hypothetical protein
LAPPLQDAYEPLGLRVGSFLLKPALEVTRGYDTNCRTAPTARPRVSVVEPTLKMQSLWSRHEFGLTPRACRFPRQHPGPTPRLILRIDVSRDTAINAEPAFLSTDYPGSSNPPVGFAKLPVSPPTAPRSAWQRFNCLERRPRRPSTGRNTENTLSTAPRRANFDQYGGAVRASYEVSRRQAVRGGRR